MPRFRVASSLLLSVLWLGPAFARADDSAGKIALARKIMNDLREWDTAANLLDEFLRESPADPAAGEALVLLGYAMEKQDRYADALERYRKALDLRPPPSAAVRQDALQGAAYAAYRLAQYEAASEYYGRFAAAFPDHAKAADARLWRAESAYQAAMARREADPDHPDAPAVLAAFRAAEEHFAGFLERYPQSKQSASALASAGFAAFDARDHRRAADHFRRFLAEFPDDGRAGECLLQLAESLYRQDDFAGARAEYARFFAPPFDADARHAEPARTGAAWCDYRLGKILDAAAGFAEAARRARDPLAAQARRYDAALAYREGGDDDGAIREFQTLVREDPDGPTGAASLARLGSLMLDAARKAPDADRPERLRAASALLRRAVGHPAAVPADVADARAALGEACLDLGDPAEAAEAFSAFAAAFPDDRRFAWALYHLALARREQSLAAARAGDRAGERGFLEQAKESLRGVFAREDEKLRLQAAYALADYLNALGDDDAARKVYRWVAAEGGPWARRWRGADGRGDDALVAASERLSLDSWFRLAESLYAAKDNAGAVDGYARVLEGWPDSEHAGMACLRLGEIAEAAGDRASALERYEQAIRQGRSPVAVGYARLRLGAALLAQAQAEPAPPADAESTRRRDARLTRAAEVLDALAAAPSPGVDPARAYYYRAEVRYALGRKAEALDDYRQAQTLDAQGDLGDALLFGLAWAKRDAGDAAGALADFRRLRAEHPQSPHAPEAALMIGLLQREGGDPLQAVLAFETLAKEYPDHALAARAQVEAGLALAAAGRDEMAAEALGDFVRSHPDDAETPRALYRLSWALSAPAAAERERAERLSREIAALSATAEGAERAHPLTVEREAALEKAKATEARAAAPLRELLQRFPGDPLAAAAALRSGEIAYDRGDYAAGLEFYAQALALAERSRDDLQDKARYRLAWCRWRLADEALRAAETAALEGSEQAAALKREGEDRLRAAQTAFEDVVANHPDGVLAAESLFRAAEARRLLARTPEDHARAARLYDEAVSREAERRTAGAPPPAFVAGAGYGSALCLLAQGDAARARERFDGFLATNPDGPAAAGAWWGRGQASLELEALEDARDAFKKAIELAGDGEAAAKARYGLGMAAMREGNWERARIEFIATETYSPQWSEWASRAMLQSARAALSAGEPEKARGQIERLKKRYPDQPAAREADAMVNQLQTAASAPPRG